MPFRDHFSERADRYARYRPLYPAVLFEFLARVAPGRDEAWDCGTGSGQAAVGLAEHFGSVLATDASPQQVARRRNHPRVRYALCAAEAAPVSSGSMDLIAAAQAAHWFEIESFYAEARRVLRPGGVLALWSYNLCSITPEIDRVVRRFYGEVVGSFWPAERQVVEVGYSDLAFPFEELGAPDFEMKANWSLYDLAGYLGTWSSTRAYHEARSADPVEAVLPELEGAWGEPERPRTVIWPLGLRVGRVQD